MSLNENCCPTEINCWSFVFRLELYSLKVIMADGLWSLMDLNISQSYNIVRLVPYHIYYGFRLEILCLNNVCSSWKDHFTAICVLIYILWILIHAFFVRRLSVNDIFVNHAHTTITCVSYSILDSPHVVSNIIHKHCILVHR
jgi:hypothetical protein